MKTPLFIDAICINQHDPEEKPRQVQLMGDVYRQAKQVVAWLPPPKLGWISWLEGPVDAVKLKKAIDLLKETAQSPPQMTFSQSLNLRIAANLVLHAVTPNPFWSRLWIVQEVILARKLVIQLPGLAVDLELLQLAFKQSIPGGVRNLVLSSDHMLFDAVQYGRLANSSFIFAIPQTVPLAAPGWRRKVCETPCFERQPLYELIASFHGQESGKRHDMIFWYAWNG